MSFVNCFDVVQMVTDEASAQFAPLFCGNKEAKAILHQYCDAIDVLAWEFDGVTFEASVHDESMEVSVTFECPDIVIRTQKHRFYDLVERSNAVRFSHGEGGSGRVCVPEHPEPRRLTEAACARQAESRWPPVGSSVRFSYRAVDKTLTFFFLRDTLELPTGQYWPRGNICLGGSLCRKLKKKR